MAHELSYGRHFGPVPIDSRSAAVLVLLHWKADHWELPLTVRQQGLGIHSGQISLPGGGLDESERTSDAALRECREELGWAPPASHVVGQLSPTYVYASNYLVTPVVAVTAETPQWRLNRDEVAELIEVPLGQLCSPAAAGSTSIRRHGITMNAPCFCWKSHCIWGATAMMLAELTQVLEQLQP